MKQIRKILIAGIIMLTAATASMGNIAPVAVAGDDQTVSTETRVKVDGTGSYDDDGDRLKYSWEMTAPAGSTAAFSNPTGKKPNFTVDVAGEYTIVLTVTDGTDSNSDTLIVTVGSSVNTPPVADAGEDQILNAAAIVRLDGSGSSDVDGDRLTYSWSFTSLPLGSTAVFVDPTSKKPKFTADLDGSYVVQLTIDDGTDSASDSVIITVGTIPSNIPPTADAGTDQSVIEGDTVTLDGSGSTDTDGTIETYAWSEGAIPLGAGVTLDISTLSVGIHTITLTVADNDGASASDDVLVTVTAAPIPNIPPTADAGTDQSVIEGDTVTLDGSGSTDTDGTIETYAWSEGAIPLGAGVTLDISTLSVGIHTITLTVADNDGASASDDVLVTVTAAPPPIVDADTSTLTSDPVSVLADGIATATITVTVKDTDSNPVTDATVTLVQTGSSSMNIVTNVGDGTYTFIVSSTTVETVTYTATANGITIIQTADVIFTEGTLTASDFNMTLDVNESTVIEDWFILSSADDTDNDPLTALVKTQGSYGTCAVTDDSLAYLKTIETNATDSCELEISDGTETVQITVTINSLYWKQISAESRHTVAIKSDGTLWSWGSNTNGQLGDGTTTDSLVPTQESTVATDWSSVSTGYMYTIALKVDGTLWSWGSNSDGQLGDGTTTDRHVPTQESTAAIDWSSVSVGGYHTVALKDDGTLWAWGVNSFGQLGDGTTTNRSVPTQESTAATDWSSVHAGGGSTHTVAIKDDGTLWAWGQNTDGQLGDRPTIDSLVPKQESTAATDWSSVSAGYMYTIALKVDGTLWAWGNNEYGQLGDGTTTNRSVPTQESTAATDWSSVSVGIGHAAALKDDGTLWAWGYNGSGQLGDGTTTHRSVPTQESTTATDWSSVSAGYMYTIALKVDGTLWAWGDNTDGQLGDGTRTNNFVPTQESTAATDWSSVSVGDYHTVAIKDDGTLWAWGDNTDGQLGDGTTNNKSVPTQESTAATDWSSVSAGGDYTEALKDDGTLWAWGYNGSGQLGDGTTTNRSVPTQESTTATDWSSVSVGIGHAAALKDDGTLWAWGDNFNGELGDGTTTDSLVPKQESTTATDWSSVSVGGNHTVALKVDGTLWAWGDNGGGQLGEGTTTDRLVPTQESTTATDWSSVSAGYMYTIALKVDGTLWAWGDNTDGQLGDGTTNNKSVPIQESTVATDWSSASAGYRQTIALKDDGTLWAWGDNSSGQLGDGTTTDRLVPTQESTTATDWSSPSPGRNHTAVLKVDGTLWTWGNNSGGQLGVLLTLVPTLSQPR